MLNDPYVVAGGLLFNYYLFGGNRDTLRPKV